jgi:hypothetical protein
MSQDDRTEEKGRSLVYDFVTESREEVIARSRGEMGFLAD